jgi:small subunit ribosomal protein S20
MPQHKSCAKRLKQAKAANERNRYYRSTMRTEIKKLRKTEEKEAAATQLVRVYSLLDKLVKKGIIHKNKASNQKSKLSKFANSIA